MKIWNTIGTKTETKTNLTQLMQLYTRCFFSLGLTQHLSLISLSFVSKSTSVLGSRIKTCLFVIGKEISSYPTSKTLLSVEQICSHHALLRHMQVWSPLWQTSEGAHQNKAWWPCAHLWEVWKDMQRSEEAKDCFIIWHVEKRDVLFPRYVSLVVCSQKLPPSLLACAPSPSSSSLSQPH